MADTATVDTKDTKNVATPEKKVLLEDEADKKIVDDIVDDDSKASENGDGTADVTNETTTTATATSLKENGSTEEKETVAETDNKEPESTGNGVSTDAAPAVVADACSIKRKSTVSGGTDAVDGKTPAAAAAAAEGGASPEKKAKLEEKSPAVAEAENNGGGGGEAEAAA